MKPTGPDLTTKPPRSARVRLGGYAILPRMLDKCRATIAGKSGEYHYNCPTDQRFLQFVGIDAEELQQEVATGKGDGEILAWIRAHAAHPRSDAEIAMFTEVANQRAPLDIGSREYYQELAKQAGPERDDIATWFDLLDLDDYVSFGGKA